MNLQSPPIPVCRPLLPTADRIMPYLKRIDETRSYSNRGPLAQEFEQRLAGHFGVATNNVITSANGTQALTQILKAYDIPPQSYCVMPSWTFIATPAAAVSANLIPYFIDVDPTTWAITPEAVLALSKTHRIGSVIVVSPFGAPLNLSPWEQFYQDTGIPVIIDAAAGFDSFSTIKTSLPFMVSLHATKVFGIGEGAVIVTKNNDLAERTRMHGNFGFFNSREAQIPGTNAKLSEYAAAVGLAELDTWPHKRQSWQALTKVFQSLTTENPFLTPSPGFNQGWVSSFGVVSVKPPLTADFLQQELKKEGIETVFWWGKGCHTHPAYRDFPRSDLTNTTLLAKQVLGLPYWIGLDRKNLNRVFTEISKLTNFPKEQCA